MNKEGKIERLENSRKKVKFYSINRYIVSTHELLKKVAEREN